MTKELLHLIEQMAKEKGISKEVLFSALESALLSAARKKYGGRMNISLQIDRTTSNISLYETKKIVEKASNLDEEISLEDAKKLSPDKGIGEEINIPLSIQDFGRIAAQTAKQVIFQRVREAEREVIYTEFKGKVGTIISGTVLRKEKGCYFVSIGKAEAVLPIKDALPGELPKRGDTIRAYIEDIQLTSRGPLIHITRTNPDFIKGLFRMEVPEISEGLVNIKDVVREPGERTKIAVSSNSPSVDPVGACVGMKGTRVQSIVRELKGERIDIIPWTDDTRMLIARALSPATIDKVGVNEEEKSAMVVVSDQQLSIAIGRKGQNVRLAMKLTGWDIDILSESEYSKMKVEEADRTLEDALREKAKRKPPSKKDG
ncbi:MAG: transcription termination/antitermination protein NusA [Nitrospirae bacterium]|nr:transcription termination/antitermination protein NusA [Nitrospirota bacterium]